MAPRCPVGPHQPAPSLLRVPATGQWSQAVQGPRSCWSRLPRTSWPIDCAPHRRQWRRPHAYQCDRARRSRRPIPANPIPAAEARGESVPTRGTQDDERRVGGDGRIGREIHADQIASAAQAVPKVPPPTPPTMPAAPAVPLRLLSLESVVFEEVASPQPQATLEMQPVLGRPPRQPNRGEASPSTPLRNVAALAAPNAIAFSEEFIGQLASAPPQLAASAGRDGGKSTADRSTASAERPAASPAKDVAMGQFRGRQHRDNRPLEVGDAIGSNIDRQQSEQCLSGSIGRTLPSPMLQP